KHYSDLCVPDKARGAVEHRSRIVAPLPRRRTATTAFVIFLWKTLRHRPRQDVQQAHSRSGRLKSARLAFTLPFAESTLGISSLNPKKPWRKELLPQSGIKG
ncbi:hypothetical protein, partial [Sinorhizobium fredii]|uniref:hypothetical protein n=1 Tax=Rhizobium fredii TaxID=380 RepID=UPI001AEDE393